MKNIYDLFNNIDVDLREYEEIKIHDNEVEDIKNRISNKLNKDNKRNKKAYKPIAATIAGLLLVTATFNTDTVSASIDKIAKTIKAHFIEEINRDFSDYTVNVGETIEDKDISVTLNEFIIDNSLIIVNHTIDYSKLDKELRDKVDYDIKIKVNDKKIQGGETGEPNIISEGVKNEIWIYALDNLEVDGPVDVEIGYYFYEEELVKGEEQEQSEEQSKAEEYYVHVPIEGVWNYNFNISDENIDKTLNKIELSENNIINRYGKDIKITEVIKSDLTLRIKYEYLDVDAYKDESMFGGGENTELTNVKDNPGITYGVFDENGYGFKKYIKKQRKHKGEVYYFINDPEINKYIIYTPTDEIIIDFNE